MKGIIFESLRELMEGEMGMVEAYRVTLQAQPGAGGVYLRTGTYPHTELLQILAAWSQASGIPERELLLRFCRHLMQGFRQSHGDMFVRYPDFGDFLNGVNGFIHPEVRKLYPDSELPQFRTVKRGERFIWLLYESPRQMAAFAEAMIRSAGEVWGVRPEVELRPLEESGAEVMIHVHW